MDNFELDELQNDQKQRWYDYQLIKHPDCSDPDHPGCECCEEEGE